MTLNDAYPPATVERLEGCWVIAGARAVTVRVANWLVAVPEALLTTHTYWPESAACTFVMLYVALVPLGISDPFFDQ